MGRLDLLTITFPLIIGIFTLSSIALTETSDISLNFNSIELSKNLITSTNNTVNNTQPLLCNGNADLCDLRYDQVVNIFMLHVYIRLLYTYYLLNTDMLY